MRMVKNTGCSMGKESKPGLMVLNTMAIGTKVKCKVRELSCMPIRISMKEISSMTKQTVEEYTPRKMVKFMMENG